MAEDILEKTYEELRSIPTERHMCCPKISEDDDEDYDDLESPGEISVAVKEQRIADGNKRLYLLYDCSLILGLPAGSAPILSDEFSKRSNAFLKACASCVRNWHRGRRPFLKRMSEYVTLLSRSYCYLTTYELLCANLLLPPPPKKKGGTTILLFPKWPIASMISTSTE